MKNREIFTQHYASPLGGILLAADACGLTGLWFDGQKYFGGQLPAAYTERQTPVLAQTKRWLDLYFAGKKPDFLPPLHPTGSAFRQAVWALLLQIPYGQTTTYGALAKQLAAKLGRPRMSAQAVGGAVGHNEISILIPSYPVPPGRRDERQPDGLRRRYRQKSAAPGAGAGRSAGAFCPQMGDGAVMAGAPALEHWKH